MAGDGGGELHFRTRGGGAVDMGDWPGTNQARRPQRPLVIEKTGSKSDAWATRPYQGFKFKGRTPVGTGRRPVRLRVGQDQ